MSKRKKKSSLLDRIHCVEDLRVLEDKDIPALAEEIRKFLIEKTAKRGGHIASNLGVVELTLALHRIMNTPDDRIIWDVGHQCYVHKIVTGRKNDFDTLRMPGGLAGFTRREESAFDPFGAGHSSTSISAALGFAEADAINGRENYTVAVIGDGALTGGLAHEGINNCRRDLRLILVLNENEMSISRVTGAFPRLVTRLRISRSYRNIKRTSRSVLRFIPLLGPAVLTLLTWFKNLIRREFYRSNYFEEMGFTYLGPYNGNDYKQVANALEEARVKERCVIVHLRTKKGKGYPEAEASPCEYHCVYPSKTSKETFHDVFGRMLHEFGMRDDRVCAITPATGETTGMTAFAEAYPKRFFDVGIAEEHALTFAAGLAAAGMKPYVAIYSSFLQRGYDQIIHDIALQRLPVHLLVDRASLAPADGATHHGIYDVAFLSQLEGLKIYAPATLKTLECMLADTADACEPIVIRYPNGSGSEQLSEAFYKDADYENYGVRAEGVTDAKVVMISYGVAADRAYEAVKQLRAEGKSAGMILLETLTPVGSVGEEVSRLIPEGANVIFLEEGIYNGGIAMQMGAYLSACRRDIIYDALAVRDGTATPYELCDIYAFHKIAAWDAVEIAKKRLHERETTISD